MTTLKDFDIQIKRATLSSGIPILLFQKKGMPIHTEIRFASGSRFDPKGKEGLAHFVEHMIVAGTNKFPSKDKMATYIEQLGGVFAASTRTDSISIRVEVAEKEDFSNSVLLFKEMLTESLFEDTTIDTERKVIFKEIGGKESNPSKNISELYQKLFFQNTEVGRSNLGDKESVSKITKSDLQDYYQNMLVTGRAVITICGDIEIDQIIDELETRLPLRNSKRYELEGALPLIRNKSILTYHYPDQDQVHLLIGFRTCDIGNVDTAPLHILSTIYGKGRASVLTKKLRYNKGLVYNVKTVTHHISDAGTWVVETSTARDKTQEVIDTITEEFTRIASGDVTDEEIKFAKDKLTKSSKRQMQTASSWVRTHIKNELIGKPRLLPDYLNSINSIEKEHIAKVGQKYFNPNSWYLAVCGDIEDTDITVNY